MAVYTELGDEDLVQLLQAYDLGTLLSCKGIAEGVENSNFLLQTERGSFILTLYERRVAAANLPYFLGLMEHLAARGLPCPTPIHGRDGRALREVAGRPAAIVTFLAGLWVKRPEARHCARLGEALGRLHREGGDFPLKRGNSLSLEGWQMLLDAIGPRADEVRTGLAADLAREQAFLRQSWPGDLPAGIIHADLFPDNVFFRGQELSGLIDFYFACNDLYAYDIAICLNAWCFESDGAFNVTKGRALLQEYGRIRPITPAEMKALPILARGAALRFLLTRLYDWLHRIPGALVHPKDPLEYLARLNFHRAVPSASAYGLD